MSRSTIYSLLAATPFASSLWSPDRGIAPADPPRSAKASSLFGRNPLPRPPPTHLKSNSRDCSVKSVASLSSGSSIASDPEQVDHAPLWFNFEGNLYRRRERSPRRTGVGTLFGTITLERIRYEPADGGVGLLSVFPLEMRLGIVVGKATLGLAERVGKWTAQYTQEIVRQRLHEEHQIAWSVTTLREGGCHLSCLPWRVFDPASAKVECLLGLLQKAHASKGPHRPVLSVGRDGIFVPIRKDTKYREAATATVAVLDRNGRRLGTVYLGQMPEPGQGTLSQQLTALITAVLLAWQGPLPRLQYVTDGGHHPSEYYAKVLRTMLHRRLGQLLEWEWVLDYYHACLYITKIAEVLFGKAGPNKPRPGRPRCVAGSRTKRTVSAGCCIPRRRTGQALGVRAAEEKTRMGRGFRLFAESQRLDGLLVVSPTWFSDRQRHHGSGVQDIVHPTLQAIGNEMVARGRTGGGGFACDLDQQAVASGLCRLCEPVIPGRQAN